MTRVGPIGRLGRYTATHFRVVLIGWAVVALGLGFLAPRVEKALSGAGWETSGSQSVQARQLIDRNFQGLSSYGLMVVVHSPTASVGDPSFDSTVAAVERKLRADPAVRTVVPPRPGASISPDGHTAIVQAGAARDSNAMVRAADDLKAPLERSGPRRRPGQPDRRRRDVVRLQRRQQERDAALGGDLLARDPGDHAGRLRLPGRRRPAPDADDGRPGRRRRLALPRDAGHADLDLGDELRAHVRAGAGDRLRALRRPPLPRRLLRLEALRQRRRWRRRWTPPARPCSSRG